MTGHVASFPLGGVARDYLACVDGSRRLGCDVFYLEDTGQWLFDPTRETTNGDCRRQCEAARVVAESAFAADKALERLLAGCDLT